MEKRIILPKYEIPLNMKEPLSKNDLTENSVIELEMNKSIWEDEEGELATAPIDSNINSKSSLMQALNIVMKLRDKIRTVSDLAFEAVDADKSDYLDNEELSAIMREVAQEMRITPPTENDIEFMLKELDDDTDGNVSKEEFQKLLLLVLGKMLESEESHQL